MNTMTKTKKITVKPTDSGKRLDVFLAAKTGESRSFWQRRLKSTPVKVNGQNAKPSLQVEAADIIEIMEAVRPPNQARAAPSLPIVYEDDDMVVVDKPAGLLIHSVRSTGIEPTVADFARTKMPSAASSDERPGIVHRLDRDTSGLLIIAKNYSAQSYLQRQFKQHNVHKTYLLLVRGRPRNNAATIQLPVGRSRTDSLKRVVAASGKTATTNYRILTTYSGYSLLEARPETGRTHQLRVHFAHLGHPVVGDIVYGSSSRPTGLKRQFLHASRLEFTGPDGQAKTFNSPLPADLAAFLSRLETA